MLSTIYMNDYDLIEKEVKALDIRLKGRSANSSMLKFRSKKHREGTNYYKGQYMNKSKKQYFTITRPETQSSGLKITPWRKHSIMFNNKTYSKNEREKIYNETVGNCKNNKQFISKFSNSYFNTIDTSQMYNTKKKKKFIKRNASVAKKLIQNKMVKFERVMSVVYDESDIHESIKNAKRRFILENYKQQRISRTNQILNEIDTTNPYMLKHLYNYKLNSILLNQEESKTVKDRLYKMLRDPKRLVAQIERHKVCKLKLAYSRNRVKAG